ncbi:MAG: YciI family protein [Bacteroidetes bacterium]|nr:YciI family protein [Bacteroidota bacterium]
MKRILLFIAISLLLSVTLFAQDRSSLYFVFLNTNPEREALSEDSVASLQKGHLANIDSLFKDGKLVAAGPFTGGGGIFILKATSATELDSYFKRDPAIQANRFILETLPMKILSGKLCDVLGDYTMQNFVFIRFTDFPMDIDLGKSSQEISELHADHWRQDNSDTRILFEAEFPEGSGGIMILESDNEILADEWMQEDPYLIYKKYAYEIKTIWIAAETFCKSQ